MSSSAAAGSSRASGWIAHAISRSRGLVPGSKVSGSSSPATLTGIPAAVRARWSTGACRTAGSDENGHGRPGDVLKQVGPAERVSDQRRDRTLHVHPIACQLDGHEDTLEQLKAVGERLRKQSSSIAVLPGLVEEFDRVEQRLIVPPTGSLARVLHLFTGAIRIARARYLVREKIRQAVDVARGARVAADSAATPSASPRWPATTPTGASRPAGAWRNIRCMPGYFHFGTCCTSRCFSCC